MSIIDQLAPHVWNNEQVTAYEAAVEAANGVIGAYSAVIAREEVRQEPDLSVIAAAEDGQLRITREREGLRSTDGEQIAAARRRYADLAQQIRDGRA